MSKKQIRISFVGVLLFVFFVAIIVVQLTVPPSPTVNGVVDRKPIVEETNTITAYEVARGGINTILYKTEVGNDVIYFTNQGGVWGHPR